VRSLKKIGIALALFGALTGFVACFHDASFKDGEIACSTDPNRLCPGGSYCIDGYCSHADLAHADASDLMPIVNIDGPVVVDGGQPD